MGRPKKSGCKVCAHKDRTLIEAHRAAGASFDALAVKFGLSKDSIWRHWQNHVSPELRASYLVGPVQLEALRAKAAEENHSIIEYFGVVRSVLMGMLTSAAEAGDGLRVATIAGRVIEVLREIGRITGEVEKIGGVVINNNLAIMTDPRLVEFQAGLVRIARDHPDARTAILTLIRNLDTKSAVPHAAPLIECEAVDA